MITKEKRPLLTVSRHPNLLEKHTLLADKIMKKYANIEIKLDREDYFLNIEKDMILNNCYSPAQIIEIMKKLKVIDHIRNKKNAKIFAHYYQIPEIQAISDLVGDSLKLAQEAQKLDKNLLLVSCTVDFMAEQAKLLNPSLKIVLPDIYAGCSIAEGMSGKTVRQIRKSFPNANIISYINVNAEVKSEVDCICTSANAAEIVKNIGGQIIMLPDYFFSTNIMLPLKFKEEGEHIAYKERKGDKLILEDVHSKKQYIVKTNDLSILSKGVCFVHEQFKPEDINDNKKCLFYIKERWFVLRSLAFSP